jgi:serine/threonine-protein kinase
MYDFGVDPKYGCYIVMEYLRGRTLEDYLNAGHEFRLIAVYDIINKILYGLRHAHNTGVIHSDIKPGNIMLAEGPPGERRRLLKILDFGIAHLQTDNIPEVETDKMIAGSPPYLAPERFFGVKPDARSDLYAVGIIMYELLTGELPFKGPTVFDFKEQHTRGKWIPISRIRPKKDKRNLLERILERALAKEPDDRYPSADEFLTDIVEAMNSLGIRERRQ